MKMDTISCLCQYYKGCHETGSVGVFCPKSQNGGFKATYKMAVIKVFSI